MPLCSATSSVIRPRCASLRPGSGFPEALAPKKPLRPLRIARRGPAAKVSLGETNQPESDHRRMITKSGAIYQPVCPGLRDEVLVEECVVDQLKFKPQGETVRPAPIGVTRGCHVAKWRQNRPAAQ
jgi:hypothetical protein